MSRPKGIGDKLDFFSHSLEYYQQRIDYINQQINDKIEEKADCEKEIKELKRRKYHIIANLKDKEKGLLK